jgi:hypothetical protein
VAFTDPQIELHSVFAAVGGASYHGHSGVRRWFQDLTDVWGEGVRFDVEAYFDLGERTVRHLQQRRELRATRDVCRDRLQAFQCI